MVGTGGDGDMESVQQVVELQRSLWKSQSRARRVCVSAILGLCTKGRGMGQGQLGSVLGTPSATGMEVTSSLWDPDRDSSAVVCGYWLPLTALKGSQGHCGSGWAGRGGGLRQHRARQQEKAGWILLPGHWSRAGAED